MTAPPELEATLYRRAGKLRGRELSFRCPAHDDTDPSAQYNLDKQAWTCFACGAGGGWVDLCGRLGVSGSAHWEGPRRDFATEQREARSIEARIAMARQLWAKRTSVKGSPVEVYLASRGITLDPPPTIGFLSRAVHRTSGQRFPCMLAAVCRVSDWKLVAIHRTYLAANGSAKASVKPAKMSLGSIKGAAVRLAPAGPRLAVTEGIETAFSVQLATGIPTWSALSATGIEHLELPPLPLAAEIIICADNDTRGLQAAQVAAERFFRDGRRVRICAPPTPGTDFNDELLANLEVVAA